MSSASFASFRLQPSVLAGVKAAGYEQPTPIQEQAIPAVIDGKDVLGLARTGTGKTAAFVLPILNRLAGTATGRRRTIRALIVAPTRELAEQIDSDIRTLGAGSGLRSATVYGGVGKNPQVKALRGGADIIVACPGRLLDHIRAGDADLSAVEVLVLDEADHMFDMGFLPDVRAIVAKVPRSAQRLLFSATMPGELRQLANSVLTDPVTIEIANTAPAETVDHSLYPVDKNRKLEMLEHLLDTSDFRSALIFTRTKHGAERLGRKLKAPFRDVATLQGNLSQNRRQRALDGFRDGKYNILVATDIAARGIDVSLVSHVINFDIPTTAEAYTHRIGRTGRAQRTGEAFTLATSEDLKALRAIEKALGSPIRRVFVDGISSPADDLDVGSARSNGAAGSRSRSSSSRSAGARSGSSGGGGRSTGANAGGRSSGSGSGGRSNGSSARPNGSSARSNGAGGRTAGSGESRAAGGSGTGESGTGGANRRRRRRGPRQRSRGSSTSQSEN